MKYNFWVEHVTVLPNAIGGFWVQVSKLNGIKNMKREMFSWITLIFMFSLRYYPIPFSIFSKFANSIQKVNLNFQNVQTLSLLEIEIAFIYFKVLFCYHLYFIYILVIPNPKPNRLYNIFIKIVCVTPKQYWIQFSISI